jgi:hypothetical protein
MAQKAFNLHNGNRKRSMATVVGIQWQKAFHIILLFEIWQMPVFLCVEGIQSQWRKRRSISMAQEWATGTRSRSMATGVVVGVQSMATVVGVQWQKAFDIILQALVSKYGKRVYFCVYFAC